MITQRRRDHDDDEDGVGYEVSKDVGCLQHD